MKSIFILCNCLFITLLLAQTPSKPTNPFPTKKTTPPPAQSPAPTPTPAPAPKNNPPSNIPPATVPPTTTTGNTPPSLPTNTSKPSLPPISLSLPDQEQIIATVNRVFDAMRLNDTMIAKPLFAPNCKLFTPVVAANGSVRLNEEPISSFFKAIGTPRKDVVDERIIKYKIDIDGPLAQVWADYNLYVNNNFIHCGVDAFHLYKSGEGWKIFELADTRRKTGCMEDPGITIQKFLDQWHVDAANANAEAYFGAMTADGVFLGTDATERWLRDEFRAWAKSAFDSKKTWNFKPSKRTIQFNQDQTIAWFDEELATNMDKCRGSGVLVKTDTGWKIKQYNLAILVPNEKIQDYLRLLGK